MVEFKLPAEYYKGIQSSKYAKQVISDPVLAESRVGKKGNTLRETFEKYSSSDGYIYHFSKKFHDEVVEFIATHSAQEIKAAVAKYDAAKLTPERLASIYSSQIGIKKQQDMAQELSLTKSGKTPLLALHKSKAEDGAEKQELRNQESQKKLKK
jgi:hypothetical protein